MALCPPEVQRDDGGTYIASKPQRWIYEQWQAYWQHVYNLQKRGKAALWVVLNGEAVEGEHHNSLQCITPNKKVQREAAVELLEPVVQKSDYFFVVRGTEAHSGRSANEDEAIADDMGAVGNETINTASWWHLEIEAGGVHISFDHHATTYGWRPWTEQAAAPRQSAIVRDECTMSGEPVPDISVYSHAHYFADSGMGTKPRVFYTRSWQLQTAYAHRRGGGHRVRPIGGLILICQDGRYTVEDWHRQPKREQPWRPS